MRYQAARFSQQCRVFAPVYRQNTVPALLAQGRYTTPESRQLAYADVLEAWRSYMKNDNRGRGVVLIGHSQGTFHLRRLIRTEIDPKPALRKQLVSALLLGGNVLVKQGRRGWRLPERARLPRGLGDGLRGRLLALQPDAARQPALRQAAGRTRPGDRQPRRPGLRGAVQQPGLARRQPAGARPRRSYPSKPFPPGFIALSIMQAYGGPPPSAPTPVARARRQVHGPLREVERRERADDPRGRATRASSTRPRTRPGACTSST